MRRCWLFFVPCVVAACGADSRLHAAASPHPVASTPAAAAATAPLPKACGRSIAACSIPGGGVRGSAEVRTAGVGNWRSARTTRPRQRAVGDQALHREALADAPPPRFGPHPRAVGGRRELRQAREPGRVPAKDRDREAGVGQPKRVHQARGPLQELGNPPCADLSARSTTRSSGAAPTESSGCWR